MSLRCCQMSNVLPCAFGSTQDQVQDVLDAMFEKTVDSGDYVIRQGDDGDNFYVIDRYYWGNAAAAA